MLETPSKFPSQEFRMFFRGSKLQSIYCFTIERTRSYAFRIPVLISFGIFSGKGKAIILQSVKN